METRELARRALALLAQGRATSRAARLVGLTARYPPVMKAR